MHKNIFVVGLDDFNYAKLKTIGEAKSYNFHSLLDVSEVKRRGSFSAEELIRKAVSRLSFFSGTVDAIVGYRDFPTTCLVPFLNHKMGLPSPSIESVLKCEHKYWSRIEQSQVITDIPKFCGFNPFDDDARSKINLDYPFWIKPVKSFASLLGFRIHTTKEFDDSVAIIRKGISRFSLPFNYFLDQVTLPQTVTGMKGDCCIAEEIISGKQCTLEGFVHNGQVEVYGVVDSIREPNRSTFARYQYPSKLPKIIQTRMAQTAQKVMTHIHFDNSPFNIEFFYDEPHNKIWLLEINPRISRSHCDLFQKVDGASNHEVMTELALGNKPNFPWRRGDFGCAAKFFLRTHEDAVVKCAPSEDQIQKVKELFPGTLIKLHVKVGLRLSELLNQESYSYELGFIFIGAKNEHELLENHRKCLEHLKFDFSH